MIEDIKYWIELSEYDLETAAAMLAAGRYLYVLFMCQQALEKMLKGHVLKITREFPPRIHNLVRLMELAGLKPGDEKERFLEKLNYYYIESRYPEEKKSISVEINKKLAKEYLDKTREIWQWLKEKLS